MRYYVVDAFAERLFQGNPAGVCVLDQWLPDELMQSVAIENNLSETAFAVKEKDGYGLRWFTPGGEIDLCGHATLGTAYVIDRFYQPFDLVEFHTKSGILKVRKSRDLYELDFPARMPEPVEIKDDVIEALGIKPLEAWLSRDLMLVLESEALVRTAKPDFVKVAGLPVGVGLLITAKGMDCDFVSRCFYPKLGINEDPVTGSAHCNFVPYWSERLGKTVMTAKQLSSRGGTVLCEHRGERVGLSGRVVLYAEADLKLEEK